MSRRRLLSLLGVGAAGLGLAACGGSGGPGSSASSSASSSAGASAAVAEIPDETAGPYPGDGSNGPDVLERSGVVRSDIRSSFGESTGTADGVPMTLRLTITDLANGGVPFAGVAVYVWHCTRDGGYSLYSEGITEQNYLRGVQVAGADGKVTFTSIFPACYSGRWPHIHVEVYRQRLRRRPRCHPAGHRHRRRRQRLHRRADRRRGHHHTDRRWHGARRRRRTVRCTEWRGARWDATTGRPGRRPAQRRRPAQPADGLNRHLPHLPRRPPRRVRDRPSPTLAPAAVSAARAGTGPLVPAPAPRRWRSPSAGDGR